MRSFYKLSASLIGLLMLLATFSSALVLAGTLTAPTMAVESQIGSNWYSSNWSGYVVNSSKGSVTYVYGSWRVPTVTGSRGTTAYSSFWVGIDGFIGSNTVEQIGTDSDVQNGKAAYYAWYEFYPSAMVQISSLTINPGDTISASVTYVSGTTFTVSITDVTTGKSYSTTGSVAGATETSAEWIAEAPSSYTGVLPLANFGTVKFGYDNTGVTATCDATVKGVTGSIGSFGSVSGKVVQEITMVTYRIVRKASPSTLSSDGTSFSVTWESSGSTEFM